MQNDNRLSAFKRFWAVVIKGLGHCFSYLRDPGTIFRWRSSTTTSPFQQMRLFAGTCIIYSGISSSNNRLDDFPKLYTWPTPWEDPKSRTPQLWIPFRLFGVDDRAPRWTDPLHPLRGLGTHSHSAGLKRTPACLGVCS